MRVNGWKPIRLLHSSPCLRSMALRPAGGLIATSHRPAATLFGESQMPKVCFIFNQWKMQHEKNRKINKNRHGQGGGGQGRWAVLRKRLFFLLDMVLGVQTAPRVLIIICISCHRFSTSVMFVSCNQLALPHFVSNKFVTRFVIWNVDEWLWTMFTNCPPSCTHFPLPLIQWRRNHAHLCPPDL